MKGGRLFLWLQFLLLICIGRSTGMKGYNFGDNKMDVRWAPDNGYLKADFPGFVPPALTSCFRFCLSSSRHGDQFCPIEIFTPNGDRPERHPVYALRCKSTGYCAFSLHSKMFSYQKMLNLIRKSQA